MNAIFFVIALLIGTNGADGIMPVYITEEDSEEICKEQVDILAKSFIIDEARWQALMKEYQATELIGGCYPEDVVNDVFGIETTH